MYANTLLVSTLYSVHLCSVEADRVRGSVTESEAVMETFGQALLYLFLTVDTQSLGETERQQFYQSLLNMVSCKEQ